MTRRTHHFRNPHHEDLGSKPNDWVWITAIVLATAVVMILVRVAT